MAIVTFGRNALRGVEVTRIQSSEEAAVDSTGTWLEAAESGVGKLRHPKAAKITTAPWIELQVGPTGIW